MSVGKDLLGLGKTNLNLGKVEHSKPIQFHYTPSVTMSLQQICENKKVFHINIEDEQLYINYKSRVAQMVDEHCLALPPIRNGVYVVRLVDKDLVYTFNLVEDTVEVQIFYKPSKNMSIDPSYKYNTLQFVKLGNVNLNYATGQVDITVLGTYDKCSYEGTTRFIKLSKEEECVVDFIKNKQQNLIQDMKIRIQELTKWFTEFNNCLLNCNRAGQCDTKENTVLNITKYDTLSQFVFNLGSIPRENLEKHEYITPNLETLGNKVKPIPHNENDLVDLGICQV